MNRLARESSPYLLLHAENPVDWYPWGDEAFDKARSEDKPIFLSVGYSTCYWCHVMERESFSDPEIARQLNQHFVSIKLDREERPDLDEIYMTATQLLTQQGGWPNSLFLSHDGKPFFAGTYFPPDDRHGRPGFSRILQAIREAWALRRAELTEQAEVLYDAIRTQSASDQSASSAPDASAASEAQSQLSRRFDRNYGGFGGAPKFPSPSNLFLLQDRATLHPAAREMLVTTLDRMARGGLQDQLAGGFHRYSVDAKWLVPHFEKMLYDNAALARLYAQAAPLDSPAGFDRVARATLDFVLTELRGEHGGLLSALDAETDGDEGAFYVFTPEELKNALDAESHALLGRVYGFDGPPNFEHGRHVLHLPLPLAEQAKALGLDVAGLLARMEPGRSALLEARRKRKRPLTDDKVLADWNGLAIGALAAAGRLLGEKRYVDAALHAARFVLESLRDPASGVLRHTWRGGQGKVDALLDDYAFLIDGLLELHDATGDASWFSAAQRLQDEQDRRLWDETAGGYFNAGDDARLLVRSKAAHDGAVASANGTAALNLLAFHQRTREPRYRERAATLLRAFGRSVREYPLGHVTLARAAARLAEQPAPSRPAPTAAVARSPVITAPALAATPGAAAARAADEARDAVTVHGRLDRAVRGAWKPFTLELTIREGFHLNANPPLLRFMTPTEVRPAESALRELRYPRLDRYEGTVKIEGEVETREGRPAVVSLSYQACDEERCLLPHSREVVLE